MSMPVTKKRIDYLCETANGMRIRGVIDAFDVYDALDEVMAQYAHKTHFGRLLTVEVRDGVRSATRTLYETVFGEGYTDLAVGSSLTNSPALETPVPKFDLLKVDGLKLAEQCFPWNTPPKKWGET